MNFSSALVMGADVLAALAYWIFAPYVGIV
jgi:hypothetical protein